LVYNRDIRRKGMSKKNVVRGEFVKFDVSGVRVTQALIKALEILDAECENGSGGTWSIYREGRKIIAEPMDGPFDSLAFNRKKKSWSEF
jgi:hypothetical protein